MYLYDKWATDSQINILIQFHIKLQISNQHTTSVKL